ncbi:hypothetical protein NRF20_02255 [Streptomyces sp. R-74717]
MAGHHPHLATALTGQPPEAEDSSESLFNRILTRVLTGLLQPDDIGATPVRGRAEAEPSAASPGPTATS